MAPSVDRPYPEDPSLREEWDHTSLRHRMLEGKWQQDAEDALANQFHDSIREHLPTASTAYNLFASLIDQTSSLFDGDDVSLQFRGRKPAQSSIDMLDLDTLWAVEADLLRFVRGLNEAYIRRGWNASEGLVTYDVITPDCVEPHVNPRDPSQPNRVRHLSEKYVPSHEKKLWCWADWDLRDPERPSYRILAQLKADGETDLVDVTLDVAPELRDFPGNWPYWTGTTDEPGKPGEGEPIWPWTLYHSKVTNWGGGKLHKPWPGREAVEATLEASTDWTHWRSGLLNSAHSLRAILNGRLAGTGTAGDTDFVPANPLFIAQIESDKPGVEAKIGQWSSAFDVKAASEAIMSKATMAALALGLAPGDVQVGASSGPARTSSIAIQVTRQGRRNIETKMVRPMRRGDQHNLAGAALMANSFGGARLPTDKKAYHPVYAHTEMTPAEVNTMVDSLVKRVEAGLLHPAKAIQQLEPWLTDDEAIAAAMDIQAFRRVLEQLRGGDVEGMAPEVEPADTDTLPDEPTEEATPEPEGEMGAADEPAPPPGVDKAQDTALNGAQVQAASLVIDKVIDGRSTRRMAIAALMAMFNLPREDAEAMTIDVDQLRAEAAAAARASAPTPTP